MALFGKKSKDRRRNRGKSKDSPVAVKGRQAPKKTKYKKKAPLSFTALEPFVDSLYGENGFTSDHEGEQLGVVLVLPFSEIGGLSSTSKEDKRNQAKGTFVASINKGDVEVYYDEKQDEAEQIVILANEDVVMTINDFSVLEKAELRWAYFGRDGELIETDYVSTVDELVEHRGDLKGYFEATLAEDDDDTVVEDASEPAVADEEDDEFEELDDLDGLDGLSDLDELPELGDGTEGLDESDESEGVMSTVLETEANGQVSEYDEPVNEDTYDMIDDVTEPEFGDESDEMDDDVAFDDNIADDTEYVEGEEYSDDAYDDDLMLDDETVDDDKVDELINQVLFEGDLDLKLPVDRFRDTHLIGSEHLLIPYYEDDGSWLTQEANRLIHEANDDIERRVASDIDGVHSTYVRLLNDLSTSTVTLFDLESNSKYAEQIKKADEVYKAMKGDESDKIEAYIEQKDKEFEERREQKGEEAKTNAMNTYEQQHRERHDRQMEDYRRQREKDVENRYNDTIVKIKADRREAAQRYFELGATRILAALGEQYMAVRKAQKEYADEWGDKLIQFLDDNRAEDIARVEVMQKQLAEDDRVAKLQAEQDAEIQRLTQGFNSQVELLNANNQVELERATNRIDALEAEKAQISKERDALESRTSKDYKELSARYNDVSQDLAAAKTKAALVEVQQSQLLQRDREIEDWKNQVDIISNSNNQNKIAFFCVAVVAVLAALLIGVIAGAQLF